MIQYYHRGCDIVNPLLIAINAKYIHTNNAVRLLKANSRFNVDFLEFTIKDPVDKILENILEAKPTLLGFSTYIWNIEIIKELIPLIKKHLDIPIVLGGPEVSYDAEEFLNTLPIDLVVKGEGERVFDDVIDYFHHQTPFSNPINISTKSVNYPIEEITSLDTLKSPHLEARDINDIPHRVQYIESSRGCPFNCSYCLSSLEKKVRFFPFDYVKMNLLYLIKHNAKTIKFLDRTFNANPSMIAIIDTIIEHHKKNQSYQFEITADRLDESIINHIHNHAPKHLFRFEIGIQSTHPITNKLVDRYQDNDALFKTIKQIIKHDIIDLHLDLIAGLPEEDLSRFKQTFDAVYRLGAKELQLGFLKMLRGTKIRYQAERFRYKYSATAPYEIIENNVLSKKDLDIIRGVEKTLNVFHNKNLFGELIFQHATQNSPFDFLNRLGTFLNHQGVDLHRYQLDELYSYYERFLKTQNFDQKAIDNVRYYYLKRAKIKPKTYFEIINDKKIKKTCFDNLQLKHKLTQNELYKHSVVTKLFGKYFIFHYQNYQTNVYQLFLND